MRKILFIDRDGTLIHEPADHQIDSIEKFKLLDQVIPSLIALKDCGYEFVMVTNQDGLGTETYPQKDFDLIQTLLLDILSTQGLQFREVLICPHLASDGCVCRKPKIGLVKHYLASNEMDRANSYVIGDRQTDLELAENLGIGSFRVGSLAAHETSESPIVTWSEVAHRLTRAPRRKQLLRKTNETNIALEVSLDGRGERQISTGLAFFDHMLDQLARHGQFDLKLHATGDLHIDEHHLVEDVAIALGQALRAALGEKRGITRYGFWLPMDEASSEVALDLSGRAYFVFEGTLPRDSIGGISTEMFIHFFRSLSENLPMSLHIRVKGENTHHMIESMFKGVGRGLAKAFAKTDNDSSVPSTKGLL
jgi:imidazoleglycerol-phosphate dehydratase/histidinol-phosphatase